MLARENNYTYLRKELLWRFYKFLFDNENQMEINRIPYDMIPLSSDSHRCCIYKDREMIKYRLLSLMGYDFHDDFDESSSLYEFFLKAEKKTAPPLPPLTVIKAACSSCRKSQYQVTEFCRGCLARPCQTGCPVDAVSIINNKATIDKEKCVNCGKCQKNCPYGSIVYTPVPCEETCPVGAIIQKEGSSIEIDREKCISCGKCVITCPFGAIVEKSHVVPVVENLKNKQDMILLVAPALYHQLPGTDNQILSALKVLGFSRIFELKESAFLVAAKEGEELMEKKKEGQKFMTTSCCPAYVEAVEKHIPSLKPFVSHTPSPMVLGAKIMKQRFPQSTVVFAGPCLAKKVEAYHQEDIDYVLNFEELGTLLASRSIEIALMPEHGEKSMENPLGLGFAQSGGVAKAVVSLASKHVATSNIDGLTSKKVRLLKTYHKRFPDADLVEVMVCEGGCAKGPCSLSS